MGKFCSIYSCLRLQVSCGIPGKSLFCNCKSAYRTPPDIIAVNTNKYHLNGHQTSVHLLKPSLISVLNKQFSASAQWTSSWWWQYSKDKLCYSVSSFVICLTNHAHTQHVQRTVLEVQLECNKQKKRPAKIINFFICRSVCQSVSAESGIRLNILYNCGPSAEIKRRQKILLSESNNSLRENSKFILYQTTSWIVVDKEQSGKTRRTRKKDAYAKPKTRTNDLEFATHICAGTTAKRKVIKELLIFIHYYILFWLLLLFIITLTCFQLLSRPSVLCVSLLLPFALVIFGFASFRFIYLFRRVFNRAYIVFSLSTHIYGKSDTREWTQKKGSNN